MKFHRRQLTYSGFTLIELMIAMVFILIAFFGYVALHSRILHSGQRLEEREKIRSATDFYAALLIARATMGIDSYMNGDKFVPEATTKNAYIIDTSPDPNAAQWLANYPPEFAISMDETMQLSPTILGKPYQYQWTAR